MTLGIKSDTFSDELVLCGSPKQTSGEKSAFSILKCAEERVWMDAPLPD